MLPVNCAPLINVQHSIHICTYVREDLVVQCTSSTKPFRYLGISHTPLPYYSPIIFFLSRCAATPGNTITHVCLSLGASALSLEHARTPIASNACTLPFATVLSPYKLQKELLKQVVRGNNRTHNNSKLYLRNA